MTNRRPWTSADSATLKRMASAGYSDAEIGAHLDRDRDLVGRHRRDMGIACGLSPALTAMMARVNARRMRLTFPSRSYA